VVCNFFAIHSVKDQVFYYVIYLPVMDQNSIRLDKWLWAARFFKTRALAAAAVSGGKVHIDRQRTKPARGVSIGNHLTITRGSDTLEVEIVALSDKRGPAKVAQALYQETEESQSRRLRNADLRRLNNLTVVRPGHRPDKRDRRRLLKHKGKT
jgi:ribosome-associated heat shock protein Hsp15